MLDKLESASKAFVLISAALYFFGFMSINGLLSRFGMISYDVVSARFLLAGFFACIAVAALCFSAWIMAKQVPVGDLLNVKNVPLKTRVVRLLIPISVVLTMNQVLFKLFSIVRSTGSPIAATPTFAPLGRSDVVGRLLVQTPLRIPGGLAFSLKVALEALVYLVVAGGFMRFAVYGFRFLRNLRKSTSNATASLASHAATANADALPKTIPQKAYVPSELSYYLVVVDLACFAFYGAAWFYCVSRLAQEAVDFKTFPVGFELTSNVLMMWLFSNVLFLYLFLSYRPKDGKPMSLAMLFKFEGLHDLPYVVEQSVVPLITALVTFGWVIFPRIPYAVGGGQPRPVIVKTVDGKEFGQGTLYLLHESTQYLYLVDIGPGADHAYQLSKGSVFMIRTR